MRRVGLSVFVLVLVLTACAPEATEVPAEELTQAPGEEPTDMPVQEPTEEPAEEETESPPEDTPEATEPADEVFQPVIGLEEVAAGLAAPVDLDSPPDRSGRLFVVDQVGLIYVVDGEGRMLDQPFLDLRDRMVDLSSSYDERGLLGLAFHPDYAGNGRFFVYYSAPLRAEGPAGWNHTSVLSEFAVSEDDPTRADPGSERIVLQVDQPQANHNAGAITFGPDGMLYVPLGDGGGANDVGTGHTDGLGNGQDISNLLGSILRIDVDGEEPYGIPEDNPFVGQEEGEDEIFAYGFRNPYRMAFDDGADGALFVGDVGQNRWEEVDVVTRGGNYGWRIREGTHCFDPQNPNAAVEECPAEGPNGEPLLPPILEYQNGNVEGGLGLAVIGGNVYRGDALSGFEGRYVFGDWSTSFRNGDGTLLVASPDDEGETWSFEELRVATSDDGRLNAFLLAFGEGADNELYVLTSNSSGPAGDTGRVWRIVPPPQDTM